MAPGETQPNEAAGGQAVQQAELPPAVLLVLNPSGQRRKVTLEPLPFTVGRQADNHLVLRDNRVSRNQFRILPEDGQYVIEDLNSRHGTWVNGERIARHRLRNSDRIDFGLRESYQLTFSLDHAEFSRILNQFGSSSQAGEGPNHLVKLRSLMEVARALQNSLSTQEVLTAVVDAALAVTGCERGFLLLRGNSGLEVAVARHKDGKTLAPEELRVPTGLIYRSLNSRRDLLSMSFDPLSADASQADQSVLALDLRSVVCLPLIRIRSGSEQTGAMAAADSTVGLVYLDSRVDAADLSGANREMLQTLAIEASTILENARLIEEERAKERIESELNVAREIQQGLLPSSLPAAGWFRAVGASIPSTQVGGDYFDVRQVEANRWAAVVADVSGKGVSSALLAGLLQGVFLMTSASPMGISGMLARLNDFLLERTRGEKYATLFYCTLDSYGMLRYANAGHCAPYLVGRDARLRKLHSTGMPVGMIPEAAVQQVEKQLDPGDKVVIFSDGLTETENAAGEFFDAERLRAFLREHAQLSAAELHAALMRAVDRFSEGGALRDDVTLLVLEFAQVQ